MEAQFVIKEQVKLETENSLCLIKVPFIKNQVCLAKVAVWFTDKILINRAGCSQKEFNPQ